MIDIGPEIVAPPIGAVMLTADVGAAVRGFRLIEAPPKEPFQRFLKHS